MKNQGIKTGFGMSAGYWRIVIVSLFLAGITTSIELLADAPSAPVAEGLIQRSTRLENEIRELKGALSDLKNVVRKQADDLRSLQDEVSLTPRRFQHGHVKRRGDILKNGDGERVSEVPVIFETSFEETPEVFVSLKYLDAHRSYNLRIAHDVKDLTPNGFVLVFKTWADTRIYNVQASWIAWENSTIDSETAQATYR